ncbi:MAG: hypothetical protein ACRDYW_04555 [Acidimicrobiales bacterium]
MRKLLSVLVSGLFLVAACGDDDGGGDLSDADQEYVDAAMATYDEEEAAPLTEDDARCIVESMVGQLGTDRLEELGVTPESFGSDDESFPEGLSEDEANGVVDGFESCADMSQLILDGIAEDESISQEAKDCLADAFDEDTVRRLFVTMLTQGEDALQDDPELTSELLSVFSECPEALGTGG